jgi:predicted permease
MILTGFVLGSFAPRQLLAQKKMHLASFLRLLLIPLAALLVFRLLGLDGEIALLAVILLALPFGLNSVIFPQTHGADSSEGARLCFASHMYSLVTLPLLISLLLFLYGS